MHCLFKPSNPFCVSIKKRLMILVLTQPPNGRHLGLKHWRPLTACESVSGYITNDYQNKISYLSTRLAIDSNVSSLLKQAAVRSLSCEVVPGKEGQIYFGDSIRGHVLSHTFFLKDAQARGFHRWYSIVVFMRDKHFLLNSWPFFQKHLKQMVVQLQNKASQVYTNEQNERSQRALRLSRPEQSQPTSRSLTKLTASPTVFAQLHLWFTWILSKGAKRLEEDLVTRFLDCNLQERQGFGENIKIVEELEKTPEVPNEELILYLRRLRRIIGATKFQNLLYSALVGHQVVIRGPKDIVEHIISLLKFLLPKNKLKCLEFVDSYQTPDVCNFIGLDLYAAVPVPSANIIRLDIVPLPERGVPESIEHKLDYSYYQFLLKSRPELPCKWPTLLIKLDKAISDDTLTDRVVFLHISSLIEQWTHTANVIKEVKKKPGNNDLTNLLQYLGVQDQDDRLIEFWTT